MIKTENKRKSIFLKCVCHSHAIELIKYEDEDEIYLVNWYYGSRSSILSRIKDAIHLVFYGKMRIEETILTREDTNKLKEYLEIL